MFIARRLLYHFRTAIPQLPHEITTIYKPDMEGYTPPNARCMLPAITMAGISVVTQWTPTNIWLTAGFAGLGWLYYFSRTIQHALVVKQIDASKDFSKLYIHLNGGWYVNWVFHNLAQDVVFDKERNVVQIPNWRIQVGSELIQNKIDFNNVFLNLSINDRLSSRLHIGPLDLQNNLIKNYKDHLRLFCYNRHGGEII